MLARGIAERLVMPVDVGEEMHPSVAHDSGDVGNDHRERFLQVQGGRAAPGHRLDDAFFGPFRFVGKDELGQRERILDTDAAVAEIASVTLEQLWWPEDTAADIHLMFAKPESQLEALIALKPNLVVIHAESDCDVANFAKKLSEAGILCGIALLPETQVSVITPYIQHLSHVLVFSGNLGHQGGSVADLDLLSKVSEIRSLSSDLEIAWDGGVNDTNAPALAEAGVQVLNTGGYIHFAYDAQKAYSALKNVIDEK